MKQILLMIAVCLIMGFVGAEVVSPPKLHPADCPKLDVSEQGDVLKQFFSDNPGTQELFYQSLQYQGYCAKQFGLPPDPVKHIGWEPDEADTLSTTEEDLIALLNTSITVCGELKNNNKRNPHYWNKYGKTLISLESVRDRVTGWGH